MICPDCGSPLGTCILDSRPNTARNVIRRRRECLACHHLFTTYEQLMRQETPFWEGVTRISMRKGKLIFEYGEGGGRDVSETSTQGDNHTTGGGVVRDTGEAPGLESEGAGSQIPNNLV